MTDNPLLRRGLLALAAVLLVGGVIGVVAVNGGSSTKLNAADSTTTTAAGDASAVAADPSTAGAPTDAGGGTNVGSAAGSTSGATGSSTAKPGTSGQPTGGSATPSGGTAATGGGQDLGAPEDPGPVTPPAAGTYKYKMTTNGETKEATSKVENLGKEGDETRQRMTITGENGEFRNEVSWLKEQMLVRRSTIVSGQFQLDCDWTPDFMQAQYKNGKLSKGDSWSADSSCQTTANNVPITVRQQLQATVGDLQRMVIGGEKVDVWAINFTHKLEVSGTAPPPGGQFSSTTESTGTSFFSPKHGLNVRETSRSKTTSSRGQPREDTSERELQSLKPS